jgi:hypothetical protein
MAADSKIEAIFGSQTRRRFLQGMGVTGATLLCPNAWGAFISDSARQSAAQAGKKITLLNDGGFQGSAWDWQFTSEAKVVSSPGQSGRRAVEIETNSGDYARFLVLGPEQGKTYTLSGWVKTQNVVQQEENAGAYFAASQYEFQGRPTEFTVDGKQLPEQRYGNFTGTAGWQRFSRSFQCLATTTWFEVVVGIYRASGRAWFSGLTFVEGDQPADLEDVVDYWQAEQWAHEDVLKSSNRQRPSAAILQDDIPVRGTASDPRVLAELLRETYQVEFVTARQLADAQQFNRAKFDLLVLAYGESFPLAARETVQKFLANGGDLLSTGGYTFRSPVVKKAGKWEFYDDEVKHESGPNLLPEIAAGGTGWKASDPKRALVASADLPQTGAQEAVKVEIPADVWGQNAGWTFDLFASGEAKQFFFQCWFRTENVHAAPDGCAYVGVEQLDEKGNPAYAARVTFEEARGVSDWHKVERLFYLIPTCRKLRVHIGLKNATGTAWGAGFRLEHRSPQVRINTEFGFPEDSLTVTPEQIGMFDPDFRLKRATVIRRAAGQSVVEAAGELTGKLEGYAATAVLGMNNARWIPLLESFDQVGRKRGTTGALVHNSHGVYARSSWAFFGVDNKDLFTEGSQLGKTTLRAVAKALVRKCFLHGCGTNFASYKDGEDVHLRVLVSNYGRQTASLKMRLQIVPVDSDKAAFEISRSVQLSAGETIPVEVSWHPASFASDRYRISARLYAVNEEIDQIEAGFNVWKQETLQKGLPFEFRDNYFQVNGKNLFLQGTDDYLHTFIDEDENPLTWFEDAQGCHDSCIDVYENLMGLRGPQQRPTEAWWRWIDAMLLNVQRVGGAFFPGMLIFGNTAVSNNDLADQKAYVRAFAARYKDAPGIMYYLNGDLELHDPNLPDLQKLYNDYLLKKYGSDAELRAAWKLSPPEAPIGKLTIRRGGQDWRDVRTLDDFRFRTQVVRRWLNALHDSIREVDQKHPVTAEFYQSPVSGIDLLLALDKLELANFGYFNTKDEDFYRFPQVCKFLDQSMRGKGINVGEFGVKTHPAWNDTGYYIEARTEAYEQAYFLAIAHYGFALGASKIQNWCWKYPSDLPFEWGINYQNDLVPRDVRAFYRNSGLLFRQLRPRYESSDVLVLLAGENRMGGQGSQVVEGQLNCIRLLLDQRLRFATLADDYLDSLPADVKTIFYPLPYCPDDAIVARLGEFVDKGGQLYLSGDISYDPLRQRARTHRLKELCGVEFVSERFPNIQYQHGATQTAPSDSAWPEYMAAPGIVTRLAGATALLQSKDGMPIVTEFKRGRGRVIFSVDPIELHGDPRYQKYAHSFYAALLNALSLQGQHLQPPDAPVHCFHVPSQDDRKIMVLVNHDADATARDISVPAAESSVRLTLKPRMSGIVVSASGRGVQAVETSGDAFDGGKLLLGTDLHMMAISFNEEPLFKTRSLLLLPMGQGRIRIPNASRWKRPVVLAGEIAGSRWHQTENFEQETAGDLIEININPDRALSMLVLCEHEEQSAVIKQMEAWVNTPWTAGGEA